MPPFSKIWESCNHKCNKDVLVHLLNLLILELRLLLPHYLSVAPPMTLVHATTNDKFALSEMLCTKLKDIFSCQRNLDNFYVCHSS